MIQPKDLNVTNFEQFCTFLCEKLNWPMRDEPTKENLTYEYLVDELALKEPALKRLQGDVLYQFMPFVNEQPWGIFLIEQKEQQVYKGSLREILRSLVPHRRKSSSLPSWNVENILFLCTYDYKDFTIAHFKGVKHQKAKLSSFGWEHGDTSLRTLCEFNLPPLVYKEEYKNNPSVWLKDWFQAFDKEKLTAEFFEAYKYALDYVKDNLTRQKKTDYHQVHTFAQQLLSRIMFLYFVAKKDWLKWKDYAPDKNYIGNLWRKYQNCESRKDTFYSHWLSVLFFRGFQGPAKHAYIHNDPNLPAEIKESFVAMPFLNGGLFSENELDEIKFKVTDDIFEIILNADSQDKKKGFLERYNFTVREDTPLDIEVAVDPEMLGQVYESLISEEERGKGGIFYTPRIEIDFMCRLSLVEYLTEEISISKAEIIPLVFEPKKILEYDNEQNLRNIKTSLDKVKVVDPAVGSASFLVGMMNVLTDMHKHLTKKFDKGEENLFELKRKIISGNLYGVDVKDWAVMVGELRLWLSLIIDTDTMELQKLGIGIREHPLLPNLSFKIRQGDSLVEEIAGVPISLRAKFGYIKPPTKEKVNKLIEKKITYFKGDIRADLKEKTEIENLENEILKGIVDDAIKRFEDETGKILKLISAPQPKQAEMFGVKPEQKELFEKELRKQKDKLVEIGQEKECLTNILAKIGKIAKREYFLWEIDFAEVFAEKGGFDIVIGNPPYVRQEKIAYPLEREDDYRDADKWRERKRQYKDKLAESTRMQWGDRVKIDKKSDLYVYFYYHGLALVQPGGVFCFINSNSWLDVGYGAELQEFLLKNMEPIYIIDNSAKRSFVESDINTVIVLIKRPATADVIVKDAFTFRHCEPKAKQSLLRFIVFKKPFEEVLNPNMLVKIENANERVFTDDYRIFPKSMTELLEEGVEIPEESEEKLIKDPMHLPYIGNKWGGKYLRAPEIYFKILEKGKDKLVRLGDIAEVRFGIKTGANDFFYLEPINKKAPKGLMHVRNGEGWEGLIEEEFLKSVIKSPRECKSILVDPKDLKYKIFMCHKSKSELKNTNALEYIKWGEKQKFNKIPSCQGRTNWWNLGTWVPPDMVWSDAYNDRYATFNVPKGHYADKRFFYIYPKDSEPFEITRLYLNSIIIPLFIEIEGIVNLAQGVIYTNVYWLKKLPVLYDIDSTFSLASFQEKKVISIFQEVGINPSQPIRSQKPNPLPDRRELDKIVFEALGLTEDEQLEVYRAVVELVKNRLVKARSR